MRLIWSIWSYDKSGEQVRPIGNLQVLRMADGPWRAYCDIPDIW